MSDYNDPGLRKRKHGEPHEPADEDVVDLDALARDYEEQYGERRRPRAAQRLSVDDFLDEVDERAEKRKNERRRPPETPAYSRPPARRASAQPTSRVRKRGRDFGEQFEEFLKQPYDPAYRGEIDETATPQERSIATLTHASALLAIPLGLFSLGIGAPLAALIPMLVYLANRDKSPFVARHALQAFAAQLAGTLGWLAIVIGSLIVGIVLTIALAITLVGIIAIPFLWIAMALFWLATLAVPLGLLGFSVVGAINASQGKKFDYPYVGKWISRHEYEGYDD